MVSSCDVVCRGRVEARIASVALSRSASVDWSGVKEESCKLRVVAGPVHAAETWVPAIGSVGGTHINL